MEQPVHTQISGMQEITRQALLNLDKSERRIRRWTFVTSIAIFITSLLLILLMFTYGSRQLNQIHAQQKILRVQSDKVAQSLQILKNATDPAALQKAHAQTDQLIYCVIDKIDYDTGKIAAIDPICLPLLVKPAVSNTP